MQTKKSYIICFFHDVIHIYFFVTKPTLQHILLSLPDPEILLPHVILINNSNHITECQCVPGILQWDNIT